MKIKYRAGMLCGEADGTNNFLLTNHAGSFYYNHNESRYGGWFVNEDKMYRVLSHVSLAAPAVNAVENRLYVVEQERNKVRERFFLPLSKPALVYSLNSEHVFDLNFDVKETYDNSEWGREYKIIQSGGKIIVHFLKDKKWEMFVVLNCLGRKLGKWEQVSYEYDRQRNSPPFSRYVFNALRVKAKQIVLSCSSDLDMALKVNEDVEKNLKKYLAEYRNKIKGNTVEESVASSALEGLHAKKGVYAGLPWFFQVWARDLAVSSKDAKLLMDNLKNFSNMPSADSDDALGWALLRLSQLAEKEMVQEKIIEYLEAPFTGKTWMDTLCRMKAIEVMALKCAATDYAYKLTKNVVHKSALVQLKEEIKKIYWNGQMLADCENDFTVRPNIFLAAYVYPDILTREEWVTCFKNALKALWLDWGGLSTLDKSNPNFHSAYTGENSSSYHNGDSWFWVNNIAAIVMHKVDGRQFRNYVQKIYEASRKEMLSHGACAELSSASYLSSEGCISQAWSAATFLELHKVKISSKDL